ncbi:MAG: endopeptidase La [Blautia sp.]|nr:endopeptidase La [Blautia sp.]
MAVLPVYNTILVPEASAYVKTDYYRSMTGKLPSVQEKVILILAKEELSREELTADSFYPIGITGNITEVSKDGYLVIHLKNRINLEEIVVFHDHSIDLSISRRKDIEDLDEETSASRLNTLKARLAKASEQFRWGQMIRMYLSRWNTIGEVAAAMGPWFVNTNQERYEILAEDSLQKRFDLMERMIYENMEMTQINQEAKSAQEEDYQKIYRESAIKKQMEYLQKELDELHPENVSDLRKLELRLTDANLNDAARKEADKILSRLKAENSNSPESGMLYDYLDFMASLPWKKEKPQEISLSDADHILSEDHYGLEKVKKRIIQQIAVMNLKRQQSGSILLFVGAPGTGKTSIGQSIAKALGREYVRVSLGGVRDEADIRGHRRTYIGAMPGRILDGISKCGTSNPVMVLDEVDKLSTSYNGDPASALLEVLDPEQNSTFTDHYLNVPFDLSDVLFICTANSIDTIPEPLLNRMEVIRFQGYTPLEKFEIARRHLLPKAMRSVGLKEDDLFVSDEAIRKTIEDFTREAGVRGLKKRMDMICRTAAVEFVQIKESQKNKEGIGQITESQNSVDGIAQITESQNSKDGIAQITESQNSENGIAQDTDPSAEKSDFPASGQFENSAQRISVTVDNLGDYLDGNPLPHRKVGEKANPGIVTGLAWTPVGGDILYIETILTKGDSKIVITGQLGDVMKESAQIAVSIVKYIFPEKAELFENHTLHIHVPDGATPKDGPSAGITLATALSSLITGVPVSPSVAMTGEISLQGGVKPIGGLPEKLMAAERSGVKTVFIPEENVPDLHDVPSEVKDKLEIIPVNEVEDVLYHLSIRRAAPVLKAV